MKKILSVILAVMMLFGALSIGAAAGSDSKFVNTWHQAGVANDNQLVVYYNLGGGKFRDPQLVWTGNGPTGFETQSNITGSYVQLPSSTDATSMEHIIGSPIMIPVVVAPSEQQLLYWEYITPSGTKQLPHGAAFLVTEDMFYGSIPGVLVLNAVYTATEPEEDTLATVLNILIKVFGAIIGIIVYGDTEAGVALMENLLGGLGI